MPKRQIIQNIADKIPLAVLVLLIIFSGSFFAQEKTLAYCSDQCVLGSYYCLGNETYQICNDYNLDGCFEFGGSLQYCPPGTTCTPSGCIASCYDECSPSGATQCSGTSKQTCGNYDADSCYEWSSPQSCAGDTSCGYDTCQSTQKPSWTCQLGSCTYNCVNDSSCGTICTDECSTYGSIRCADTGSYQTCGNYDTDGCWEWSPPVFCQGGQVCHYGNCIWSCTNECSAGQTQCSGTTQQICGNYDADPCYEWSTNLSCIGNTSCGYGACQSTQKPSWTCQSGGCIYTCVNDTSCCTNECSAGQTQCSGTSKQICGNYDADSCYEWSSNQSCTGNTSCGYGTCQSTQKPSWTCQSGSCIYNCVTDTSCETICTNECSAGQTQCSGTSKQTCGNYDADSCYEWSSNQSCTGNTSCGYGTCLSAQKPNWTCQSGACVYNCVADSSCGLSTCTNECSAGQTRCSGTSKQTCGNYDADSCYEWSSPQSCAGDTSCGYGTCQSAQKPNWTCQNGSCIYTCVTDLNCGGSSSNSSSSKECTNECPQRYQTRCSSATSIQVCGIYYDSDPCLEWYSPQSCTGDTSCGYGTCQEDEKPYWSCENNQCVYVCSKEATCIKEYAQNYEKKCSDNDLYWFDSNGQIQNKIQDCEDNNPDTGDRCENGQCVNDSSYCETGEHCGDNVCNCQEDAYTCFKDCEFTNLTVSVFAKKPDDQEWKKTLDINPEDEVDVFMIVANNSGKNFENITVKTQLPKKVSYKGDLKIDGVVYSDNISEGISLGSIPSGSEKRITFKTQVLSDAIAGQEYKITGRVEGKGVFGSDSADIAIGQPEQKKAGFSVLKWLFTRWYLWLIAILLLIFFVYRYLKRKIA